MTKLSFLLLFALDPVTVEPRLARAVRARVDRSSDVFDVSQRRAPTLFALPSVVFREVGDSQRLFLGISLNLASVGRFGARVTHAGRACGSLAHLARGASFQLQASENRGSSLHLLDGSFFWDRLGARRADRASFARLDELLGVVDARDGEKLLDGVGDDVVQHVVEVDEHVLRDDVANFLAHVSFFQTFFFIGVHDEVRYAIADSDDARGVASSESREERGGDVRGVVIFRVFGQFRAGDVVRPGEVVDGDVSHPSTRDSLDAFGDGAGGEVVVSDDGLDVLFFEFCDDGWVVSFFPLSSSHLDAPRAVGLANGVSGGEVALDVKVRLFRLVEVGGGAQFFVLDPQRAVLFLAFVSEGAHDERDAEEFPVEQLFHGFEHGGGVSAHVRTVFKNGVLGEAERGKDRVREVGLLIYNHVSEC